MKLFRVAVLSAVLTVAKMASAFSIAKFVAVQGGPAGLAMLGQVQNLVAVLNGFVAAPAGNATVRFTAQNRHNGLAACAPWWSATLAWLAILLAVTVPAGIYFSHAIAANLFDSAEYRWIVILVVLLLPFSILNLLMASVLNGMENYRHYIFCGIVSVLVGTAAMFLAMLVDEQIGALLAAGIYSAICGVVMAVGCISQPWFRPRYWFNRFDKTQFVAVKGYIMMAATTALVVPSSQVMVRNILVEHTGWVSTGQWQAVYKISEVYLGVITIALSTYYLPRLAKLNEYALIRKEIFATAKIIVPISILAAVCVFVCRDLLIRLLFSPDFLAASDLFRMQLCGDVLKVTAWIFAFPMVSKGATKWYISTEVVFSMLFPAIAWYTVPAYGASGAVLAYTLNYALYLAFLVVSLRRYVGN